MLFVDLAHLIAESLQRLRREAGLTQAEMARVPGISRPTLNRLESASQNMTLRTLAQLCRALRCEPGISSSRVMCGYGCQGGSIVVEGEAIAIPIIDEAFHRRYCGQKQ